MLSHYRQTQRVRQLLRGLTLASALVAASGSPCAFAKGLDAASFLVADAQDKRIYGYDASGLLVGELALDPRNGSPSGIVDDGDIVYVLDRVDKLIYRYNKEGFLEDISAELRRLDGGGLSIPAGLAIQGDEAWVVDRGRVRLFRYSLSHAFLESRRIRALEEVSLQPANIRATGLAIDPAWLYVLDESDRQIYRYARWGSGSRDVSSILRQSSGGSLGAPSGVAVTDGAVFVTDRGRDEFLEYDPADLFAQTGPPQEDGYDDPPARAKKETPANPANDDGYGYAPKEAAKPAGPEPPPLTGITGWHNGVRTGVKPPADPDTYRDHGGRLPNLAWDPNHNLVPAAQAHVNECIFGHTKELRALGLTRRAAHGFGENLARDGDVRNPTKAVESMFRLWSAESKHYDHAKDSAATQCDGRCGHYTQIIWDDTRRLGCAIARNDRDAIKPCNPLKDLRRNGQGIPVDREGQALLDDRSERIRDGDPVIQEIPNQLFLACYYDPAGNFPRKPYTAQAAR